MRNWIGPPARLIPPYVGRAGQQSTANALDLLTFLAETAPMPQAEAAPRKARQAKAQFRLFSDRDQYLNWLEQRRAR